MERTFALISSAFGIIFAGGVALIIILIVRAAGRERERRAQLRAYALQLGWFPIIGPVPGPVAQAVRSRRTKIALGTRRGDLQLWVVWHQWTESSGGENSTSRTENLTRYYLWLGPGYPDVKVSGRTGIGAFFKPVRGIGTGDLEFDKRFLIRPTDRHEVIRLVNPVIRRAMLAGYYRDWEISGGTLALAYGETLRIENLQPRADGTVHLAGLLAGQGGAG